LNSTPFANQITLDALFDAYFSCRQNKRNTINALRFEAEYEQNLITLCDEINQGTYQPGKSIAFVIDKPVKREIFAADFRDRVVHHLIISKLNPLFEKEFIYDSYACRVGKGTHFGIKRVDGFIRKCSKNYTQDCYVLKLDIEAFFMHIDKGILFNRLAQFIKTHYRQPDQLLILSLCQKIIENEPTKHCIIKGKRSNWDGLPSGKSLFHSPKNCGLPIGNLTSQIFANFYMNAFDHFVKHDLGVRYYGRYVDDSILVHQDKLYLQSIFLKIDEFLKTQLKLSIHPKKIYFQHYSKGVKFLGVVIKPHRIYIQDRIKGNFYDAINRQNKIATEEPPNQEDKKRFLSIMNTYLGLMKHYKTYRLRKRMALKYISSWWWNRHYSSGGFAKLVAKQRKVKKARWNQSY